MASEEKHVLTAFIEPDGVILIDIDCESGDDSPCKSMTKEGEKICHKVAGVRDAYVLESYSGKATEFRSGEVVISWNKDDNYWGWRYK